MTAPRCMSPVQFAQHGLAQADISYDSATEGASEARSTAKSSAGDKFISALRSGGDRDTAIHTALSQHAQADVAYANATGAAQETRAASKAAAVSGL